MDQTVDARLEIKQNIVLVHLDLLGYPLPSRVVLGFQTLAQEPHVPRDHKCVKGFCMTDCTLNGDCAKGEQCVDGMCLKLCHTDKNCLQGEICIDKFCRTGCNVDNDCRNGETCQNEKCLCSKGFISTPQGIIF